MLLSIILLAVGMLIVALGLYTFAQGDDYEITRIVLLKWVLSIVLMTVGAAFLIVGSVGFS